MIRLRKLVTILVVFLPLFSFNALTAMDIRKLLSGDAEKGLGQYFIDKEFRKSQLNELEKDRKDLESRAEQAATSLKNSLQFINEQIVETNEAIKKASGSHEELLNKKVTVLEERKQAKITLQELWKEVDGNLVRHIDKVKEIVNYLEGKEEGEESKSFYSWKDFDEKTDEKDSLRNEIAEESSKKESLKKLEKVETEEIGILKKEIDSKAAERQKVDNEYRGLTEQEEIFAQELKTKSDVIGQEIDLARDKIEIAQFKLEDFVREEAYKKDEIFLLKQRFSQQNRELSEIQKKLRIEPAEVAKVKDELAEEAKKASVLKSKIAESRNRLKGDRRVLNKKIEVLEKNLAQLKEKVQEKSVEGYLASFQLSRLFNEGLVVDRQLSFLDTRKESIDTGVLVKGLQAQVIEVLHTLSLSHEKLEGLLVEFRAKKRAAENTGKILKDRRNEITSYFGSISKEEESLYKKRKELKEQQNQVFKGRAKQFFDAAVLIDSAIKAVGLQREGVEKHIREISELLLRQEVVINRYNNIIKYLESEWTGSIWKRSPQAISLQQLGQSLLEIEKFFKDFFWNTPSHLGPNAIFAALKTWDFADFLGVLLFFLLLFLLYFGCRFLLSVGRNKCGGWFSRKGTRFTYAARAAIEGLFDFLLTHFFMLFMWLFVFCHVVFGLSYFKPLTGMYATSFFYLVSIPILMHLSYSFIFRLKTLNKESGYLFIAEESQWKIATLLGVFLHATSILLPLRRAFLEYFDYEIVMPSVSLAMYELILLFVVLFFLNKEDVLRLFSSKNPLVVWLRKAVDRYYYPVFAFLLLLVVLSRPYFGYSRLAWYLAFAIPASMLLLYGLLFLHYVVRQYSLFFFIKEEDDEVVNKFENAKAYYGLFVAVTFIILALGMLVLFARIWGFEGYTPQDLWRSLSEDWVLGKGTPTQLGFIELIKFVSFVVGGLIISSLTKRFILGKLFEIFRTEPGVQDTVSRILHYVIILLSVVLGFIAANLSQYAYALVGLIFALGFALREHIADYFSGMLVLLERPLEIGHYVEVGEFQGKVHRITARSTTIKTARNFLIVIPNRDLITAPIVNWGQGRYAVGCEVQVMVSYDSDPEVVKKVLHEVMSSHSMVLRVPAPVVRFEGFEQSALYFYCRCYVSSRKVLDMWDLASDLRLGVVKAFKENNIVIPYQQTVVHFAKNCKKTHADEMGNLPVDVKFDKESMPSNE